MKDFFQKGLGFRSFMLNMEKDARVKFMKYYIPMTIGDEYREKVNSIKAKVRILGVVDGDCPDCHINLPVLEKLISTNNNIDMRLVTKDYLNKEVKVPTFIFMDDKYRAFGEFIEMPKKVKEARNNSPEGSRIYMEYKAGRLVDDTLDELIGILMSVNSN